MKLIVDAGGTKTRWRVVDGDGNTTTTITTAGINAVTTSVDEIKRIIIEELLPRLGLYDIMEIYYYGAGVIGPEQQEAIAAILKQNLGDVRVEVYSDLIGTARALCGHRPGIACILGTGSNSCYYDGKEIVANTSPLGYILGDEGGGASIGKAFLNALFKNRMPAEVMQLWKEEVGLSVPQVIENVYRRPGANTFLASLVPFVSRHIDNSEIEALVCDELHRFISNNVKGYSEITDCKELRFTGSIARVFEKQLGTVAHKTGYNIVQVVDDPLPLLVKYHK